MDSKTLFIAFNRMLNSVQWEKHGENEYVVVGDGISIRLDALDQLIRETFSGAHLWVSLSKKVGYQVGIDQAASHAAELIGPTSSVNFSDESLTRFLQIHPLGVARTGRSNANSPL